MKVFGCHRLLPHLQADLWNSNAEVQSLKECVLLARTAKLIYCYQVRCLSID